MKLYAIVDKTGKYYAVKMSDSPANLIEGSALEYHVPANTLETKEIAISAEEMADAGLKDCCKKRMKNGQCEPDDCENCAFNDALSMIFDS